MQAIKQIQALNKRELENVVPPSASWHADYRDTAFVYFGGLDPSLSEGDIITIFSQYGEPTHIRLIRDKDTGKSKGYGFLKYEDQRSTDLAVDNLSGSVVVKGGMQLRVEHARYEKRTREGEEEEEMDNVRWDKVLGINKATNGNRDGTDDESRSDSDRKRERKKRRPLLKEERELQELMDREDDEEDPMKEYLINEKKAEVEKALARVEDKDGRKHRHRHRHRRRNEHRDSPSEESPYHRRHHRRNSEDSPDFREPRQRSDRRRDSKDRRRSRDRGSDLDSPPRHYRRNREPHRHRSQSHERRK